MRLRVLAAGTLARVPSEGLALAVVLAVAGRGGSAAFAGFVLALTTLPQVVTGPLGGALLDRSRHPQRLVAAAALGSAVAVAGLAATEVAGVLAVLAALTVACVEPILTGGLSAVFTRWATAAPGVTTARMSAWDGVAYNVAGVAGPLVVTTLAATAGAPVALGVLAATVAPGALAVLGGPALPAEAHAGPRLSTALAAMWGDRPLRGVTIATTLEQGALGGLAIAMVAAAAAHGHTAEAAGTVLTVRAATALASSLALTRWGQSVRADLLVLGSIGVGGAGLLAMGIVPWWLLVGLGAVVGFADGPVLVGTYRARAEGSPAALRASVFTVGASLKLAASSGGAVLAGVLLADRATSAGLAVIGGACVAGALLGRSASRQVGAP